MVLSLDKKQFELLFKIVPAGVLIALEVNCKEIFHNPIGAKFLRINDKNNFSYSLSELSNVQILREGKILLPEEMPIQRAAWFGEEVKDEKLVFIWEDGVCKTAIWHAHPLYNENGIILGAIATFEEINEQINIAESIGDPFFVLDNNFRFVYVNKAAELCKSKSPGELVGQCIWKINPQAIDGYVHQQYKKVIDTKQAFAFEALSAVNNRWYEYNVYPYNGGVSVYLKDISERKRSVEEVLEQAQEMQKLAELLDFSEDQILVRDMNDIIIYWNKGAEKGYGWSKVEVTGKNCNDLFKTQFPQPLETIKKELLEQGYWKGEVIKTRKAGTQITLSSRWALIRDKNGKPISILEINTDITNQKAVVKALQESERRFREVFYSMFSFMCLINPDGTRIATNRAILDFVGREESDIKKNLIWEAPWWISRETKTKIKEAVKEAGKGKFVSFEAEVLKANGNIATVDFRLKPVKNEDGEVVLLISEGQDLTDRKNFEREMLRLDRLNVIGQAAAGISHEIRNPLTTVRGFLQILREKDGCYKYKDQFDIMIEELDRANSIITEFLSLAKDKAVKKEIKNLNEIINTIYPLLVAEAVKTEKNLIFEQGEIPNLLFDEKEIRQLIHNLTRNGMESMSAGGILIIRTYEEDDAVVLTVQDQGIGIEQSILDKLGTPFLSTKDYGTGLGLAVCLGIIARHNAKMSVETGSTGTAFTIRFKK